MKKILILVLAACMTLVLLAGCGKTTEEAVTEELSTMAPEAEETAAPAGGIALGGTGYETYPADTIVGTVEGEEITWMEYYYWLNSYVGYIQQVAAQYGLELVSWDGNDLSPTDTNGDVVVTHAQTTIAENHAIRHRLADLGVELTEEDEAELQDLFDQNADRVTGDANGEATDEERLVFEGYLHSELHIDHDFFDSINADLMLSQRGFERLYGEQSGGLSTDEVLSYAENNGVMAAKHILLLTVDPDTRESLSQEEIDGKRATAEQLLGQLEAVRDDPEALETLFDELTAQYTEDTGYAAYPEGYIFSEGEMVAAFEEAVRALEVGGLSGVVESEYGYHIILRIPVDPDGVVGVDANGNTVALRDAVATQRYNEDLARWAGEVQADWYEGFETPDLKAIFG